jgi:hypothetical protein
MQCEWMVCGVVAIQGLSFKWYLFKFMCFLCNGLGGGIRMSFSWSFRWSISVFVNSLKSCEICKFLSRRFFFHLVMDLQQIYVICLKMFLVGFDFRLLPRVANARFCSRVGMWALSRKLRCTTSLLYCLQD